MAGWTTQKAFGAQIRSKLAYRGWTVTDLAVLVNCSPGYLFRVVRGEQEPAWSLMCNIAKALGCFLEELTDDWQFYIDVCPYCRRPLLP